MGYHNYGKALLLPVLLISLTLVFLLAAPLASTAEAGETAAEVTRLIVGFRQLPSSGELAALRRTVESFLSGAPQWQGLEMFLPNAARIRVAGGYDPSRLEAILRSLPFTSFVEEDKVVEVALEPDDPRYGEQWHLPSISAPAAWDATTGSASVTIAIIDTGVDYTHPDLAGRCVAGYNYVARNGDPMDDHGHGTHVAGIAAATGNNSTGVAGMDWKARIMPLKVLDSKGTGYESDVAEAMRYAADHGAKVINLSLGSSDYSYALQEGVDYAYRKGVTVVVASGNKGSDVYYPGACEHAIAVGALDSRDNLASFSNRGPAQDVTAPGVSILSTVPGGYGRMSGTSMASPLVAGCAALVLAKYPAYTPSQVEKAIKDGAVDLGSTGFDTSYGFGKVDAASALGSSQPAPAPSPAPDGGWNPSSPGGKTMWYLAEGYTAPGYDTYVLVQNPNAETASLRGEFVDARGNYRSEYYTLAGRSRLTLSLDAIMPDSEISTCVSSLNGVGVVVERSMYFDCAGRSDGHCCLGSPGLSETWLFAEGYTGDGFDEYILVFNPWLYSTHLKLTLYDAAGSRQVHDYSLLPISRTTIRVNDLAPGKDVSARLETEDGVVAERAMYFDYQGRKGGHCTMGSPSPSREWFFAEGYTGDGFDEWLLLFNPADTDRTATVKYRFNDGSEMQANYIVRACSRYSVHVNREAPDREVALQVSAGGDGVVAERAMYFDYRGVWDGGHCTEGARAPREQWNLAEGYTGPGFETWVLVQNVSPSEEAEICMAFMSNAGIASIRTYQLKPCSRTTFLLNQITAAGDVSVSLYSADGVPVVVERAMYFDYGGINGGSVSLGSS